MRTLKTDNLKIEVVLQDEEQGLFKGKRIIVRAGGKQEAVISTIFPQEVIKSKFSDAAFARHILNFLIKD